jgi:hypothetical protein
MGKRDVQLSGPDLADVSDEISIGRAAVPG